MNHRADEFPLEPGLCYLNHAAVSPWPARTCRAVARFAEENARYGAARYPHWIDRTTRLRDRLRSLINAQSADDIALLKNTSEALSVVAWGIPWRAGDNVVVPGCEFPSNRLPWEALSRLGVETRIVPLRPGQPPETHLLDCVDKRTRALTVSSVQFGDGLRMDLERLGAECRRRSVLFCVDAIQSLGALPFDVQACHADFVTADAHKWMLGPEGIALFYSRPEAREQLQLNQQGWAMMDDPFTFERDDWTPSATARRFEPGSLNTTGAYALDASLSLLQETGMSEVAERVLANTDYLMGALEGMGGVELFSSTEPERRSGIVTFRPGKGDVDVLYRFLTERNIICAQRGGGIRFSPHFYTPRDRLELAVEAVVDFCS